jgi:hypothetical protein
MKYLFLVCIALVGTTAFCQPDSAKPKEINLQDRFDLMKTTSQTFQDYKVIKEVVLDGVWKISQDSVNLLKGALATQRGSTALLEKSLSDERSLIEKVRASQQGLEYDSTHISIFGVSFGKTLFVSGVFILLLGMLLLLGGLFGKLRMVLNEAKETKDLLNFSTHEFEEYKRKSLEKQAKLSRELQTERNRIASERTPVFTIKPMSSTQTIL